MSGLFDAAAFAQATDVSRETLTKLEAYAALLEKWQRQINLVSKATIPDLWQRHMLDSAQLSSLIEDLDCENPSCIDMGTGAGFPGMVLAIMGVGQWTLVDSDSRKVVFLQEAARVTQTAVQLITSRLEDLALEPVDIVTARACAPLVVLLGYAAPLMHAHSTAIFLKGQSVDAELETARKDWDFQIEAYDSVTDPSAKILRIQRLRRV